MPLKVAINGYGRIGRNVLRALYEGPHRESIKVVSINDLAPLETKAHLTRFDSTHGHFSVDVKTNGQNLQVGDDIIEMVAQRDPHQLPWKAMDIDVVYECTGRFTDRVGAEKHLHAGAKKVLISAPGKDVDATIVYGVNHQQLTQDMKVVSNASCTTNCLAPIVKPLHGKLGIVHGMMNTIHSYTNDQKLVDANHKDLRRARAAGHSIIPTKTGAAKAVGLVLPELAGKLDGLALRVPTMNVSVVDLTFEVSRQTSVEEVNQIMQTASQNELAGIVEINTLPLVSCDFNHNPASATFDVTQTKVIDRLVKILAWYDNEWGFSNRMLDVTQAWMGHEDLR